MNGTNFLVSIYHQENQSWQGSIQWLDSGNKVHFRSQLELLTLMNDAVEASSTRGDSLRSWEQGNNIVAI